MKSYFVENAVPNLWFNRCRVLHDIHDNLKDIYGNYGNLNSAQSAAQATQSATSLSTGNLSTSDESSISNSGNTILSDFGAIEAAKQIALSGLGEAQTSTLEALKANADLAKQTQQGEVTTLAKGLGWIAAGLLGIYLAYKFLVVLFGGRERKHA